MLITPRVSEKSYKLTAGNVYVFDVPLTASKAEIIAAIESQYEGVKIRDARMLIAKGKVKAVNRGKRSRPGRAARKDTKKAYVTVAEGEIKIAAFDEVENQAKAEQAEQAKTDTKVAASAESKKAGLFAKRRTGRRGDK
jgi:large subunit ribosomal protein L23